MHVPKDDLNVEHKLGFNIEHKLAVDALTQEDRCWGEAEKLGGKTRKQNEIDERSDIHSSPNLKLNNAMSSKG
jgi:hypothetical protein